MLKDIAGIAKTETQNRKAIYRLLQMDKVPDKGKVLLAFLGHPRFTNMFKKDHPNTEVFVLENQELNWLYDEIENVTLVNPVNINEIKEALKDMKFDYIIMNPPYNGNLHLKILEEAMKHSNSLINLSPVRWLQDPLASYKKSSDFFNFENIGKHIQSLKIIPGKEADALFNIQCGDLGIYKITPEYSELYKSFGAETTITTKIMKYIGKEFKNSISSYAIDLKKCVSDFYIYVLDVYGGNLNGSLFIKPYGYKKPKASTSSDSAVDIVVEFSSEKEARNFSNTARCLFFKWLMNEHKMGVHYRNGKYFPWMGDQINPRTGLKGYESEWTDEDFYKFFDLTDDEIKIIEETMEKYK